MQNLGKLFICVSVSSLISVNDSKYLQDPREAPTRSHRETM